GVVTLHRPSNVDDPAVLAEILKALGEIQKDSHLIFPVHPRTRQNLEKAGLMKDLKKMERVILSEPLGYLEMVSLMLQAGFALTDSGGIQEETTVLGVPCLTVRNNTERPITIEQGMNRLVGQTAQGIIQGYQAVKKEGDFEPRVPELWDGKTAVRIVEILTRRQEPV
ncbi:MAG: UDP-N-acetylglucosamine 2-epimerase, partial [Sinomicrobium sp.]|nr:UDP-N-acetylglucosamine 2-epimerase [Sinomicrobium sp.]